MAAYPISFGDPGISGIDVPIGSPISQGGGIGSGPDILGIPLNPPVGSVSTPSNGGGFWGDLSNLVNSATKVYSTYEQGNLLSQQIKAGQTPSVGLSASGTLQPAANTAAGQLTSLLGGSNATLWILIILVGVILIARR